MGGVGKWGLRGRDEGLVVAGVGRSLCSLARRTTSTAEAGKAVSPPGDLQHWSALAFLSPHALEPPLS